MLVLCAFVCILPFFWNLTLKDDPTANSTQTTTKSAFM